MAGLFQFCEGGLDGGDGVGGEEGGGRECVFLIAAMDDDAAAPGEVVDPCAVEQGSMAVQPCRKTMTGALSGAGSAGSKR